MYRQILPYWSYILVLDGLIELHAKAIALFDQQ
jgi:hypothetical protein